MSSVSKKESPITIKDFGNVKELDTVEDLQNALENEYRKKSISVTYLKASTGMRMIINVTVDELGQAKRSYGTRELLDFNLIRRDIVA
jgi:hypothetical protein